MDVELSLTAWNRSSPSFLCSFKDLTSDFFHLGIPRYPSQHPVYIVAGAPLSREKQSYQFGTQEVNFFKETDEILMSFMVIRSVHGIGELG